MNTLIRGAMLGLLACPLLAMADYTVVQITPMTGTQAATGKLLTEGASLVFKELNEKGGIAGQKIRYVVQDDAYKPDETVRLLKQVSAEKPVALLGLTGTANVSAAIESGALEAVGVPVVGAYTGATMIREKKHPQIFHLRASYAAEVEKLVEMATTVGQQKIAVLHQNDGFGQDGLAQVKKSLAARKLAPVAVASYERGTTQMGPAVEALAKADAAAIIMISSTVATSAFVKGYREKGGFAQLYTLSVNSERDIVATVGPQSHGLGISQVFPVPSGGKMPMTRDYLALLKKHAPDAKPSEGSLEGYVYARVLVEAMRRAGAKAGDPAAITKALESAPFDLGGFTVSFAPGQHEGSNYVELTMLNRNGELVR